MSDFKDDRGFVENAIDENGIARISFGHPAHNSFPSSQLKYLAATIAETSKNSKVKVILLQSEGNRTFCAGASLDELLSIDNEATAKAFFSAFGYVMNAIRLSKKLVVCRVQGKAIGGGLGLAATCDYCLATVHAAIRLSELGLNIGPFVIGPAVERKIGLSAFTELTLNPHVYKEAHWAKDHGLYNEIYADMEQLDNATQELCLRLSSYSPAALSAIKEMFWHNTQHWDHLLFERAAISGKLALLKESRLSLQAFKKQG